MRRRRFLTLAGTWLACSTAGCQFGYGGPVLRRIELTDSSASGLAIDAAVFQPSVRPGATALLDVRFRNPTSDQLALPFLSPVENHEDSRYHDQPVYSNPIPGTRSESGSDADAFLATIRATTEGCPSAGGSIAPDIPPVTLQPSEAIPVRYRVYGSKQAEQCLPPGVYEFSKVISRDGPTWAVSLQVSEP